MQHRHSIRFPAGCRPFFRNLKEINFLTGPTQGTPPSTSTATVIIGVLGSLLAVALCVFVVVLFRKRCTDIDKERRRLIDQNGGNGEEKLTYQSNNVTEHLTDREDNVNQDLIKSFVKNPIGGSRYPSTSCKIRELKKDNVNKLNAPL